MYDSVEDGDELGQGDVVGRIRFPLQATADQELLHRLSWAFPSPEGDEAEPHQTDRLLMPWKPRFVMVVSHDCEFNPGKRKFFHAARIEAVPANLSGEQLAALRANDVRDAEAQGAAVQWDSFWLEPIDAVLPEPHRVNFGTITPFPMSLKEEATACRKARLDEHHRKLLREKLGLFFTRPEE